MLFLGVDPGLDGALGWISDDDRGVWSATMPTLAGAKRRSLDLATLRATLDYDRPDLCVVERVSPAPVRGRTQGALSMFSFGRGLGQLEGLLTGLEIPYQLVTPQAWKASVLAGTAKDKAAAVAFVAARFPGVSLTPGRCRVQHHGMAESLCMALHAQKLYAAEVLAK